MKLKLDINELNDDFFDNTRLLGIIAPLKNYNFCWQLNNTLGVKFTLNNDFEINLRKKRRDYYFNIYQWQEPQSFLVHYLYHNHNDGEYLLPEFKHIDYLWLMKGDFVEEEKCDWIKNAIKNIAAVQLVTELFQDQIKNKGNMIF